MPRGTCLTIAGITMGALMIAQPASPRAQMQPPNPNKLATWECSGPYAKLRVEKGGEVKDGMTKSVFTVDGKEQWIYKPVSLIGLTIFTERDRADGKGKRGQKYDEKKLAEVIALKPGGKASLTVDEWHNNARWKWQYSIEVSEPKALDHPVLGRVQTVTFKEKRSVQGGNYASNMDSVIVPDLGLSVSWVYKDDKGTEECELTAYN